MACSLATPYNTPQGSPATHGNTKAKSLLHSHLITPKENYWDPFIAKGIQYQIIRKHPGPLAADTSHMLESVYGTHCSILSAPHTSSLPLIFLTINSPPRSARYGGLPLPHTTFPSTKGGVAPLPHPVG